MSNQESSYHIPWYKSFLTSVRAKYLSTITHLYLICLMVSVDEYKLENV